MSPRRTADAKVRRRTERLEWALGLVSGAIVLAIVGYLAVEGLTSAGALPDLVVAPGPAAETDGAGQLRFTLANRGGRPASAVAVSLTLRDGDRIAAVRRLMVDQVPARSTVSGAFLLPPEADGLSPTLAVDGYLDP